ncbi:MAG: carbohydrate ABC transporter permease [Lachnospiraceae bacterium]|jgi:putative aldouronate transport system permease protein|nr:carbohydrate ABC transporter permease [Lachnospiraceae bacterium]
MVEHDRLNQVILNIIMIILCLFCVLPFVLLVSSSITDEAALVKYGYSFIPKKVSFEAYRYLLGSSTAIVRGYGITILVTVVGTFLNLVITTLLAYPLSRHDLPGRNVVAFIIFFSMLFNGGIVPSYIMWSQIFHIKNTIWALIVPNLMMNAFYVIMMRTNFNANVPDALIEAARIDGADEWTILAKIVLPISKPILATVTLMVGLSYWNDWINGLYYINKDKYFSIQILLNRMLQDVQFLKTSSIGSQSGSLLATLPSVGIKMAVAVMGVLPIMVIYPFFQKYFIKGITIGAVKG